MPDYSWEPSRPYFVPEFQYSEALPGQLWLGEAPRPQDFQILRDHGITDIVNLTQLEESLKMEREAGFTVHSFPFPDGNFGTPKRPTGLRDRAHAMMLAACEQLSALIEIRQRTYLHCLAGISRSPTVFLLWKLQTKQASTYDEALEQTFRVRPLVSPNRALVEIIRELHPEAFQPA